MEARPDGVPVRAGAALHTRADRLSTTVDNNPTETQLARRDRLAELLEGCAARHEASLAELYELCSSQLYGVLLRMVKIDAIAEEALQESFVKIWNNSGSYSSELGTPMTWMSSIARNHALDLLRRRSRREGHEIGDMVSLIDATPDAGKSPSEMSEDAEALLECLDRLQPVARECIVQSFCEGYSHEELSSAHDTPIGTVKSWIRRGLLALRSCLDEHA